MPIERLQEKAFFPGLNSNMIIFKYIFFRIYNFYNKRWPNHDPEIYAVNLVIGSLGITAVFVISAILHFLKFPPYDIRRYYFIILGLVVLISFILFNRNDIYKKYIVPENYTAKWFQGWRGDVVFYFFFISQAFLILMALVLRRNF